MAVRISFILPCYNVEKYVEHCIDSILAVQLSEDEYEVLCFDDGSRDATPRILDRYAKVHKNVHVFHSPQNVGMSKGRNSLLNSAKGEYIWFVDSDDSVCSQSVQSLLHIAEKNDLEVLAFNYSDLNEDGSVIKNSTFFKDTETANGVEFIKNVFGTYLVDHIGYVWRFIYKREHLLKHQMYFPEGCWEDTVYMPKAIILADRVQSTSITGYEYWHHQSSICRTMERRYPGKMLYEFTFVAGVDLYILGTEVEDKWLKEQLQEISIRKYFNFFPPYLCRAGRKERKIFYSLVRTNRDRIRFAQNYMRTLPKLLVTPVFGPIIAEVAYVVYKIKHMNQ